MLDAPLTSLLLCPAATEVGAQENPTRSRARVARLSSQPLCKGQSQAGGHCPPAPVLDCWDKGQSQAGDH